MIIMLKLAGYKPGDDLTVMNVMYEKSSYDKDFDTFTPDYAYIVFKDNKTGKKHVQTIKEPTYTYYIAKPGVQVPYNLEWIDISKVDPVTCKYREIKKSIATQTGNLELFKANVKSGNYKMNETLLAHPRVFAADMNILSYLRMEFADTYTNPVCPISIAYYDIENDIIDALTDEVVIGECPINLASIYFDLNKTVYSFVLRNPKNPLIAKFEAMYEKNKLKYRNKVNEFIVQNVGSPEKVAKYKIDDISLVVGFFDDEVALITTFFGVMKSLSPDFAVAYNASYDLRYLIERLKVANIDPLMIISDDDFERKFYSYYIDMEMYNEYEERKDFVMMSSKTTWLDQMIIYPSRRKGQNAISSFSLDNVVNHECGVHKLDWHHITDRFSTFAYKDFETFWLYNINDTIVQACLEAQTEDIRYIFNNVIEMNTPYQKIFRQTNYLYNKAMEFYKKHEGVIMGGNVNRFGTPPDIKFPGAFVAKPTKLSDKNKVKCKGHAIMKFTNADDFDFKALYPSLIREFNMSISTQLGMIDIQDSQFKPIDYLRLGTGGHYSEDLASYNTIQFGNRWMNLPDIEQMLQIVSIYFERLRTPQYKIEQGIQPILMMDKSHKTIMSFVDNSRPITFNKAKIPDWVQREIDSIRKGIRLD